MITKRMPVFIWLASIFFICAPITINAQDTQLLWLVNPNCKLQSSNLPQNLTNINGYQIRKEAGDAFLNMLKDMKADGITNMRMCSAYRPYQHQKVIFENKVKVLCGLGYDVEEARKLAAKTVATPGASEHQLGIAIDVTVTGQLNVHFGTTEAGVWLQNNSDRYGFIVRYPKEKTEITKIIYEPWHLRYVGIPHAAYMQEYNMCLEEYIAHVKESGIILYWVDAKSYYKISYSKQKPEEEKEYSSIGIDEGAGYIVTEFKKVQK